MTATALSNPKLDTFIAECKAMLSPDNVVICDGTKDEFQRMFKQLGAPWPALASWCI